jgi:type II secretory pathway pseudopilin PulG
MFKRGQIWIETVIYTLIAFVLIGAVLAFAMPKINEVQDKAIIEQSISLLKGIDNTVLEIVQGGSGNKRKIEIGIKKGELILDGVNEEILFKMESASEYSEPGKEIPDGNIIIKTEKSGKDNLVILKRVYEDYNLTYNGKDEVKTITKASTSYNLFLSNKGKQNETWHIDAEIV